MYENLYDRFGPQHWWPKHEGSARPGFDPRFEVMVGAILTQNTAWTNVEKAIANLYAADCLDAKAIASVDGSRLKDMIRPAGYFNQKAKKLKILASADVVEPTRRSLLSMWGIGRETADSILLYAFNEPIFVVDAYTRRLLALLGRHDLAEADYDVIRNFFELNLPRDTNLYNEFHALIVAWAKAA